MDLSGILASLVTFFVLAASPGPATLAAASVSMQTGRKGGLVFALGLAFGLAFWGAIAATGLGAVLQSSAVVLSILKAIGGLYLIWLAYGSARSALTSSRHIGALADSKHLFRQGFILNLSNPKAVLAWMAALSVGMSGEQGSTHVIVSTLVCMLCGAAIYVCYSLVFSAPQSMAVYRAARRWIDTTVAAVFALAGLGLLRSAFER